MGRRRLATVLAAVVACLGGAGACGDGGDAGHRDGGGDDAAGTDGSVDGDRDAGGPDAGGPDAGGLDAGTDGGGRDAGADAGGPDAGAMDGSAGEDSSAGDGGRGDAASPDAGGGSTFDVLTVNLRSAFLASDTWPQRRDMIVDAIERLRPDAVCVQEATETDDHDDGGADIAIRAGYEHVGKWTHEAFLFEEGIAVLSRWPILWSASRDLPHDDLGIATRAVLGARVDSPFGEVQVFCTHMLAEGNDEERADQSVAILGFMDDNPSPLPSFLGGDLNAEPSTLPMQVLRGDTTHDGTAGELQDGWLATRSGDDGFTIPSDAPDRRIDYVYAAPGSDGATATATECSRELTEPEGGVYASDHLAVLCRFSL